jgi:hydroxypyruvate reductase
LLGSTDGSDGPNDAAGARVDGQTVRRAATDARAALDRHDSYTWLQGAGALLRTGATHTNVTDVWIGVQP